MKEKIEEIIRDSLKDLDINLEDARFEKPFSNIKLFGSQGLLDSIGLVTLISSVESKVLDGLNVEIIIASEKAMSQQSSPFRTIQSLTSYVDELIKEQR